MGSAAEGLLGLQAIGLHQRGFGPQVMRAGTGREQHRRGDGEKS